MTSMPPARMASTAASASSGDGARTTGMMPVAMILPRICRFMSALHPCSGAGHDLLDLGQRRHGCVAGRGHRERAMRCAALDRPGGAPAGQEAVDQTRRERIAPADPVIDREIGPRPRLLEA